jgi:hypothetical protein
MAIRPTGPVPGTDLVPPRSVPTELRRFQAVCMLTADIEDHAGRNTRKKRGISGPGRELPAKGKQSKDAGPKAGSAR